MKQLFPSLAFCFLLFGCVQQDATSDKLSANKTQPKATKAKAPDSVNSIKNGDSIKPLLVSMENGSRQQKTATKTTNRSVDAGKVLEVPANANSIELTDKASFISDLRKDYLEQFPPEEFEISGNEIITINTAAGSSITVKPTDLETIDGERADGIIHFYIKEMVTPIDMLRMHAPTISNGEMLESGGAWYINATASGKPLRIKQGKTITISVRKQPEQEQQQPNPYNVFTSSNSTGDAGVINWQETNQLFTPAVFSRGEVSIRGIQLYDEYFLSGKRKVYPAEVWQIHKTYFSKETRVMRLFGNPENDLYKYQDYYLSELTEKHNMRLGEILDNGEIVNRIINRFGAESRVAFLFEYGRGPRGIRLMVDSVAITDLSPWLSKRLKKVILKKITAFNKEYFKRLNQANQLQATYEMASANLSQFGWINCDRFSQFPNKTFYYTHIKGADSVSNMQVYMVFKTIKSLLSSNQQDGNRHNYRFDKIPPRKEVMLVAAGFNGKQYFAGKSEYFSVQPQGSTDVEVAQMSKDEMQDFLQKLQ